MTRMTWDFILSGWAAITWPRHSRLPSVPSSPRMLTTARRSQVKALVSVSRVISATEAPGPGSGPGHTSAPRLIRVRVSSRLSSRYEALRESKLLPCKFTEHTSLVKMSSCIKLPKTKNIFIMLEYFLDAPYYTEFEFVFLMSLLFNIFPMHTKWMRKLTDRCLLHITVSHSSDIIDKAVPELTSQSFRVQNNFASSDATPHSALSRSEARHRRGVLPPRSLWSSLAPASRSAPARAGRVWQGAGLAVSRRWRGLMSPGSGSQPCCLARASTLLSSGAGQEVR